MKSTIRLSALCALMLAVSLVLPPALPGVERLPLNLSPQVAGATAATGSAASIAAAPESAGLQAVANGSAASVKLSLSGEASIAVNVSGEELEDVYAFDLILEYDALRLSFEGAKSEVAGFSVQPIVKGNTVRIAHTKVGLTEGVSGTSELATLRFARIRGGEAGVRLREIKLVNSQMETVELTPKLDARVAAEQAAADFNDMAGHWAEAEIAEAADLGIVAGFEDGSFRPEASVTRNELTVMLARALLLSEAGGEGVAFADSDAIPDWAKSSVRSAAAAGLIAGYSDSTFRGGNFIVRQELATIAVRALGARGAERDQDAQGARSEHSSFADEAQIEPWARGYAAAASEAGLMGGKGQGRFAPLDHVSRAEAAVVALRLIRLKAGLL